MCGSTANLVVDHIDGDERNDAPSNLRWLCKSCNTRLGLVMARAGQGRRTVQFNPGAETLAAYVQAAVEHDRGAHDAGGLVIHQTPKEKRQAFAKEIWRRRRRTGH
ncbi:MAG TPA: HNH endonuclease signature motif containing protein [Terriglobia bacterium]|nr:HNH endonuclease signature motif containing protein [Terriglobia bacterium]